MLLLVVVSFSRCGTVVHGGCTGFDLWGFCTCAEGYWGPHCDNLCPGMHANGTGTVCGGFGWCGPDGACVCQDCASLDAATGVCVDQPDPACGVGTLFCNTDTGQKECDCRGAVTGDGCLECGCESQDQGARCNSISRECDCPNTVEYFGDLCRHCSAPTTCSGHGTCSSAGNCDCTPPWFGADCNSHPPLIVSAPSDRQISAVGHTLNLNVQFTDPDTSTATHAMVLVHSSTPSVVSPADVSFSGSDGDRTVHIAPTAVGTVSLTVEVLDVAGGGGSAMAVFIVDVAPDLYSSSFLDAECLSPSLGAGLPPTFGSPVTSSTVLVVALQASRTARLAALAVFHDVEALMDANQWVAHFVLLGGSPPGDEPNALASFPTDLSPYTIVMFLDLSQASDPYGAELGVVASWFHATTRQLVVDARLSPTHPTNATYVRNLLFNMRFAGGGLVVMTGSVYAAQHGANDLLDLLAVGPVAGAVNASADTAVDAGHPITTTPATVGGVQAGIGGHAPRGAHNATMMYVVATYAEGGAGGAAITASFTGGNTTVLQVHITSPTCDETFPADQPIDFSCGLLAGGSGVAPTTFVWEAVSAPAAAGVVSFTTQTATSASLPVGQYVIQATGTDAGGTSATARVRFFVKQPAGYPCDDNSDCHADACVDGYCCTQSECGHGTCAGAGGTCDCDVGFTGSTCDACAAGFFAFPTCRRCSGDVTCSGHGDCAADGTCHCDGGWFGDMCSQGDESTCAAGWATFAEYCYKFENTSVSHAAANTSCTLASIPTADANDFVQQLTGGTPSWVGLGWSVADGDYAWADDAPVTFTAWHDDEVPSAADCVGMAMLRGRNDAAWSALPCSDTHTFVCSEPRGCPAGLYMSDAGVCQACPVGTFSDGARSVGAEACDLCPAGRFGDVEALTSSSCSGPCPVGHYCPAGTASNTSHPCPAGRYGAVEGLTTSACTGLCPAGYYCPAGAVSNTSHACPAGRFGDQQGLTSSACSGCACFFSFFVARARVCVCVTLSSDSPVPCALCSVFRRPLLPPWLRRG